MSVDKSPAAPPVRPGHVDWLITGSVLCVMLVVLFSAVFFMPATRLSLFGMEDWIVEHFAWLFSSSITFFLLFCICLAGSRMGKLRLGPADSVPDFSLLTWLAMLFSAGMGIGLVFFGVAEPLLHYLEPPYAEAMTPDAARQSMRLTLFHWGLHAWGIYVLLAVALGWWHFRMGEPLAMRSTLRPLLGRQTHGVLGKSIDTLAVLGTLFGLATSLGLGAAQINAGLHRLLGWPEATSMQVAIIVVVTMAAIISLLTGLDRGIRRLSEANMILAILLLLFVLLLGPTAALLRTLPDTLGNYLSGLVGMSLRMDPFRSLEWQKAWTIFYWAWWLSWAPFVGTFIARISRGRTVRELVFWVLLVPLLASLCWFGVFGGAALRIELFGEGGMAAAVQENSATAIFSLLAHYPLSGLTSTLAIILVAIFFISSSDSGSFVVDVLASGGNPSPAPLQRVFWASLEGGLAITLLLIGGLDALQAGAVSLGLPFCIVMLGVAYSLWRSTSEEANRLSAGWKLE